MKGHNYKECRKCGKFHEHHRGNLGKHLWKDRPNPRGMLGKNISQDQKDKISMANMGKKNRMWKGDDVGIVGLHSWIKRHKTKVALCQECNKKEPFDLANISGKYKRDINDFEWLCRRCHMIKDGRFNNLKWLRRNYAEAIG